MNKRPIEEAEDRDLRFSHLALHRAAQRARELAAATGTALVISRNGVIEHLEPISVGRWQGGCTADSTSARQGTANAASGLTR